MGSLHAALKRLDVPFVFTADAAVVADAAAAIFPGDGAFAATMDALRARGLDKAIHALTQRGTPFLGICVGMQVLFEASSEFGTAQGLGILPGHVEPFAAAPRVPHMGWNQLDPVSAHPFVRGIKPGDWVYFLHSYRVTPNEATAATATHGDTFTAVAARGNVMGTQFHPEKSGPTGAQLLRNFIELSA